MLTSVSVLARAFRAALPDSVLCMPFLSVVRVEVAGGLAHFVGTDGKCLAVFMVPAIGCPDVAVTFRARSVRLALRALRYHETYLPGCSAELDLAAHVLDLPHAAVRLEESPDKFPDWRHVFNAWQEWQGNGRTCAKVDMDPALLRNALKKFHRAVPRRAVSIAFGKDPIAPALLTCPDEPVMTMLVMPCRAAAWEEWEGVSAKGGDA